MEIFGMELENLSLTFVFFAVAEIIVYLTMKRMTEGASFWLFFSVVTVVVLIGSYIWANWQANK